MRLGLILITISMLGLPHLVNAAKSTPTTLNELVNKALAEGDEDSFGENISRALGWDQKTKAKSFGYEYEKTVDNRARSFAVTVEESSDTHALLPTAVVIKSQKIGKDAAESYFFRLQPAGKLEKAFTVTTKLDASGKAIRGSGVKTDMAAADAQARLKKELDFWLNGVGLKPADKKVASAK